MPRKTSNETPAPPPGAGYQPAETLLIQSPEQLKIIGDPLRMEILECVITDALTVKQIAARLGHPPTRLYYHVGALEEAGFMVVVDTRIKSGIVEKYYRIAAQNIQVDRSLLGQADAGNAALQTILGSIFDATITDLQRSFAAGLLNLEPDNDDFNQRMILARSTYHLRPDDVPRFVDKIRAVLAELDAGEDAAGTQNYACTIAFYPRVTGPAGKTSKRSIT